MSATVLSDKPGIKCRKRCQCIFCYEDILVGETYDYRTGVSWGDFWQMKMHPECNAYSKEVCCEEDFGEMTERFWTRGEAMRHAANHAILKV